MKNSKKHNNYWTKKKCLEESKKYKTRTEFQKNSKGSYLASYRNGWLDEICSHMEVIKRPNGYWTKEKCQEEALKYTLLKDFRKNSSTSYDVSYKNGWLDEICSHMSYRNCKGYSKNECLLEGKKHKTKQEFKELNNSVYIFAYRQGWLDEICSHMKNIKKQNGYWNKDRCKFEALKHNTKKDFRKMCVSAYNVSLKNKWIDEICSHMKSIGNKYKRCIYSYEFEDKCVYVGLTYNLEIRNKQHYKRGPVFNHINMYSILPKLKKLTKYINIDVAKNKEDGFITKYKEDGWNILNNAKAGALGSNNVLWTYDKCKSVSLKCETLTEFYTKYPTAYLNTYKNDWKDELCFHMKRKIKPNGYWTKEKCQEEALKYNTRTEFQKNSVRAYNLCRVNKWLDTFCSHMN